MLMHVNDGNFEQEVLKSDIPVLLYFTASWCGPCRVLGPIVDELSQDFEGKPIKIAKMDVDENLVTPGKYGIMSVPTLIMIKDGEPVDQMVGVQPKDKLAEKLEAALA